MAQPDKLSPETLAAQALAWVGEPYRNIAPALHPSTTFERAADGSYPGGRVYARDASPAYDQVEALLCALEEGQAAALFASGMAAATAVLQSLRPGAGLVAPRRMYWALRQWMLQFAQRWQIDLRFYENADLEDFAAQVQKGACDLVWLETPANPTWEITDIAAAVVLAHAHGARVVVDSTVATPLFTRPLAMGADIVMHSATKYLNGHSDVVAGALITRQIDTFWQEIKRNRALGGATLGAFESWLLLRGLRTLYPRVRWAAESAACIARHFEHHPRLLAVLYPGLASHPQYATACRQMQGGFGAMLSLRVRGGDAAAMAVAGRLRLFKRATSLGSVESLVEHRASVEGPGSLCPGDLLRISVGIEQTADLLADLEQALGDENAL